MFTLSLPSESTSPFRVLCIGAHSDDIEIGCGGLILSLLNRHRTVEVDWIVFSALSTRYGEARRAAQLFLRGAGRKRVVLKTFRDGFFPFDGAALKEEFERLKENTSPDLILTHYREDRHQDHRLLSDLTWNTFRNHWILEYEIPKFDGDLGCPNCFVPLSKAAWNRKLRYLDAVFVSQQDKSWFTRGTFAALMQLRGVECRAPSGYAEAFYARKVTLGV